MLKKIFIPVSECKDGDIIAVNVRNSSGVNIIARDTVINSYIKIKLQGFEIKRVWVFQPAEATSAKGPISTYGEFREYYTENVLSLKTILSDISKGKQLNLDQISGISNYIYSEASNADFIIRCLSEVKTIDEYTYQHSINVSLYAMLIGKWMGLPKEQIVYCIKAGLIHDIGKILVPQNILNKPGRLTQEEFEVIKKHVSLGYDIIKNSPLATEIKSAVIMHHERVDGSGYPYGISGEQISTCAKIIAVSDVYDAMISERVYKKKVSPFDAFKMFQTIGITCFDIKILNVFLNNISAYYTGAKARCSDGQVGDIVYIPPYNITKPVIKIKSKFIDLSKDNNIKIESLV